MAPCTHGIPQPLCALWVGGDVVVVVEVVVVVVPSRLRVPGSNARWMTNGSPGPGDGTKNGNFKDGLGGNIKGI